MHDELGEPLQVELFAASLRADSTDISAFMEALASKLTESLPSQTQISRQSGLFARTHPVKEIMVTLGDYQYRLIRDRHGSLLTSRAKVVRGIVLKTEQIAMEQWIDELAGSLAQESTRSTQARSALERFLI